MITIPTAVQALGDEHDTPDKPMYDVFAGTASGTRVQRLPSHLSLRPRAVLVVTRILNPTAMQNWRAGHDTDSNSLTVDPLGAGVG
jgi:hypothetical protein